MNDLNSIWQHIVDLFDDFYCDVALIEWATKTDTLASLINPNSFFFDPLQTIGKYE